MTIRIILACFVRSYGSSGNKTEKSQPLTESESSRTMVKTVELMWGPHVLNISKDLKALKWSIVFEYLVLKVSSAERGFLAMERQAEDYSRRTEGNDDLE